MVRRSMSFRLFAAMALCTIRVVDFAVSIVAVPFVYLLQAVTGDAVLTLTASFKLIAYRVIEQLKPVYRDSYLTHGLSLGTRSTA
ncbi:hypothetical protein ACNT8L_04545 [Brucella intermedia]|uniref:hypothetical protein n=1 Tax=Brucella intermedia TaxID=94625 RepID=UPI003AB6C2C9